jgi:glyoxylase-like metal-dependent hydrolase (beta-lactamase superfamily II)
VNQAADPPPVSAEGHAFASAAQRIEYLPVDIPAPGDYAQVAPGILWLRIPMPMDLNHINLWLLEDGDGWTLVDTGLGADMCREAWESLIERLFVRRALKRIFVTHLHPDHVGLAHWLQRRFDVPVWMSARGIELTRNFARSFSVPETEAGLAFVRSHGLTDTEMLNKFFTGRMYRVSISGVPRVDYHPADGEAIAIGLNQWQALETNGHAEGHQCLWNTAQNILISGDQVLPTISANISYGPRNGDPNPLKSYLDSLQRLGAVDRRTLVLPSHGRPFYGLAARAADLAAHHQAHLQAVLAACTEPKNAFELIPVLFKRRLLGALWLFAMGDTIAHTEYLAHSG